jgi:hypothetical protein
VILQGSCKDVESPRHKLLRVYGWLVVVWPHLMTPFWQNKCVLTIKHYLVINVSKLKFWKWRTVWFSLVGRSQIWFDILVQWHGENPRPWISLSSLALFAFNKTKFNLTCPVPSISCTRYNQSFQIVWHHTNTPQSPRYRLLGCPQRA